MKAGNMNNNFLQVSESAYCPIIESVSASASPLLSTTCGTIFGFGIEETDDKSDVGKSQDGFL